jgi:hypothetical protein
MPNDKELDRKAALVAARRAAKSQGVKWKELSPDERKARRAAAQVTDADRTRAAKKLKQSAKA